MCKENFRKREPFAKKSGAKPLEVTVVQPQQEKARTDADRVRLGTMLQQLMTSEK